MKKVTIKLPYEAALVLSYSLSFIPVEILIKYADDDMKTALSYVIEELLKTQLLQSTEESNSKRTWRTEALRAACNIELKNNLTGYEYTEEHIAMPSEEELANKELNEVTDATEEAEFFKCHPELLIED